MKDKQSPADARSTLKVANRKHLLGLYLIIVSITGFFAIRFYLFGEAIEAQKCGGLLSGDNGEFEYSPPPTGNKPKSCVWLIQAYDSSVIRLKLQAFEGKEGSTVVLHKQSEPGQIHLHPIVLSHGSVGKTVDAPGSTFLIILPQADSSSISFQWDSAGANYSAGAYQVTIAEYMGTPAKRLAWQPRRTQERLWWIIGGNDNELPNHAVEYKTKGEQYGCAEPCDCFAFQAFQVDSDGFLVEIARNCVGKASGGNFKVNSYPLVIAASANTTLQGATRVELHWPPGQSAAVVRSSMAGAVTKSSDIKAPPADGATEMFLTTHHTYFTELKAFPLGSLAAQSVVNTTGRVEAIAYNPNKHEIYFSTEGTIFRMDVDGRSSHKLFSIEYDSFRDLEFDHVTGLLYALTFDGYVFVCNHTSSSSGGMNSAGWTCIRILNTTKAINETTMYLSIALNPAKGEMYLGTAAGGLLRAEMDGSNVTTIFKGTNEVTGIVVDDNSSQLYWLDSYNALIQWVRLDRTGAVETLLQLPQGTNPEHMVKIKDTLYWSTFEDENSSVQASSLTGEKWRVVYSGNHSISNLAVVASRQAIQGQVGSRCDGHGCSHMCVPTAQSFRCLCPEGMQLLQDSKTCASGSH